MTILARKLCLADYFALAFGKVQSDPRSFGNDEGESRLRLRA
jgi:hypothetical protein